MTTTEAPDRPPIAATYLRDWLFYRCRVRLWTPTYLETIFDDGLKAPAVFTASNEDWARAKALGYAHPAHMHLEHDLLHTFLAERQGLVWSPTLRYVAEAAEKGTTPEWRDAEEAFVCAFQRYRNTGHVDEVLDPCRRSLPAWRDEFLRHIYHVVEAAPATRTIYRCSKCGTEHGYPMFNCNAYHGGARLCGGLVVGHTVNREGGA